MRTRAFFNRVTNSQEDVVQKFIDILEKNQIPYAIIGGIGVNAYCEPVVTLDFDCVVAEEKLSMLRKLLKKEGFKVKMHPYTIEVKSDKSDIRIQLQRDKRLQPFLKNAKRHKVLGYELFVASKENILNSKIAAYLEPTQSPDKRAKDLSDIIRLVKTDRSLIRLLPKEILVEIDFGGRVKFNNESAGDKR